MIVSSSLRIIAAQTISCRHFLGANCIAGTLLVDKAGTPTPAQRIVSVAAGGKFAPKFAIITDDDAGGAAQKSRIHCSGATDATIFYSV